jgi:hypothetical protein
LRLDVPVNHCASSHLTNPTHNCGPGPHLTSSQRHAQPRSHPTVVPFFPSAIRRTSTFTA